MENSRRPHTRWRPQGGHTQDGELTVLRRPHIRQRTQGGHTQDGDLKEATHKMENSRRPHTRWRTHCFKEATHKTENSRRPHTRWRTQGGHTQDGELTNSLRYSVSFAAVAQQEHYSASSPSPAGRRILCE